MPARRIVMRRRKARAAPARSRARSPRAMRRGGRSRRGEAGTGWSSTVSSRGPSSSPRSNCSGQGEVPSCRLDPGPDETAPGPAAAFLARALEPELVRREVLRQRNLLRRAPGRLGPRLVGDPVPALVRLGAPNGENRQAARSPIDELAADVRGDAHHFVLTEISPLALDEERERPLEDDVDLLLALVPMDPPALARAEDDQVEAERLDAEVAAETLEALARVEVELRVGDAVLHLRKPTRAQRGQARLAAAGGG